MKERPILVSTMIISIVVEIILIVGVFINIGSERLFVQIMRLAFQLMLISFILGLKSRLSIFILTGYHIVVGIYAWQSANSSGLYLQILAVYHVAIGMLLFFHDWIEGKIKNNPNM